MCDWKRGTSASPYGASPMAEKAIGTLLARQAGAATNATNPVMAPNHTMLAAPRRTVQKRVRAAHAKSAGRLIEFDKSSRRRRGGERVRRRESIGALMTPIKRLPHRMEG